MRWMDGMERCTDIANVRFTSVSQPQHRHTLCRSLMPLAPVHADLNIPNPTNRISSILQLYIQLFPSQEIFTIRNTFLSLSRCLHHNEQTKGTINSNQEWQWRYFPQPTIHPRLWRYILVLIYPILYYSSSNPIASYHIAYLLLQFNEVPRTAKFQF